MPPKSVVLINYVASDTFFVPAGSRFFFFFLPRRIRLNRLALVSTGRLGVIAIGSTGMSGFRLARPQKGNLGKDKRGCSF